MSETEISHEKMEKRVELSRNTIKNAQKGDDEAFGCIYEYYMPQIYRFVCFRVKKTEDAEDLVTKIFIKAWKAFNRYDENKSSLNTWLFTIARRTIIDFYRVNKEDAPLLEAINKSEEINLEKQIDDKFLLKKVKEVLDSLPKKQAEVIALRYFSELSIKEISEIVNKSEGAVRVLLHRSLKKVKEQINS